MNTLEQLRRSLEIHASAAPDGLGMAERARTRAVRLRRRRRIFGGTGAALALVLVAAGVPLVVRGPATSAPEPPSGAAPDRTAARLGLGLAPGSGFTILMRGSDDNAQFATVRTEAGSAGEGGDVRVHDPGTFDPAALRRGRPVTVGGKPAWFVTELPGVMVLPINRPGIPAPAVGWEEPGGVWVTVGGRPGAGGRPGVTGADQLIEVAEAVRLGTPEQVTAPFRLGWLPEGLPISRIRQTYPGPSVRFEFGTATGEWAPLTVAAQPASGDGDWPAIRADMSEVSEVGAVTTRYLERPSSAWGGPDTGADMAVETDRCLVYLHVLDRSRISRADLERIVANATFGDCSDPANWQPPVG